MAKFIVCEAASLRGKHILFEDMRIVAINVDCIDALHQDIFNVEYGDGSCKEQVGLEVCSSRMKSEVDGRLIMMMDYEKFLKEVNNETA